MAITTIGGTINSTAVTSNLDFKYGPYSSKQEAYNTLGPNGLDKLALGLTVGIIEDGVIREYWFRNSISSADDLVLKSEGKSAYDLYAESVPSGQTPMTEEEWLDSLKGETGDPGHNPNLGTYTISDYQTDAPTEDIQPGDYISVIDDTDPSDVKNYIYTWNGTAWTNTNREVGSQFATEEYVSATSIINDLTTGGEHDVLSAEIGKELGKSVVYDISKANSGVSYSSLAGALGTNGANIPSGRREGGMSIKFKKTIEATYSIVKTEGLENEPTGTELGATYNLDSGTYTESQLSGYTLPTTIGAGNALTYYFTVTGDTTTYTSWVFTKLTDTGSEYEQYRYTSSDISNASIGNTENWRSGGDQSIYDVSANNNGATFASLSALLSDANLSTLIPSNVRCGGMSIRFVQSSDNKYVQYMYIGTSTTVADFTNLENWEKINLEKELCKLEQNFDELNDEINGKTNLSLSTVVSFGGYYSGNVGQTVSFNEHQDFSYMPYTLDSVNAFVGVDVSEYIGKTITFVRTGSDTSGASIKFTDNENIIIATYAMGYEGWIEEDGIYTLSLTIPTNTKYLYWAVRTGVMTSIVINNSSLGLKDVVENNTARINALENNYLQPSDFPVLPYKIIKNGNEYKCEEIVGIMAERTQSKIYVDSINGLDTNTGTEDSPKKTLKAAITAGISTNNSYTIEIINDGAVFLKDDLYGEASMGYDVAIVARTSAFIIGGVQTTFSAVSGYSHVYACPDLSLTLRGVVNCSETNKDKDGFFNPMTTVSSVALVEETADSYYIAGGVVYVHLSDITQINNVYPIVQGHFFRFTGTDATRDKSLSLKNLNIVGGVYFNGRGIALDGYNINFYAENCIFQHNFQGDNCAPNNFNTVYLIDCKAGFGQSDAFNQSVSTISNTYKLQQLTVLVNCFAKMAGIYTSGSPHNNNLYTAHTSINVLRCGCRGENSEGPMVADVNGCRSVNYDCEVINTYFKDTGANIDGCYKFSSVSSLRDSLTTLVRCYGYDVRTANLANTPDTLRVSEIADISRMIFGKLELEPNI